MPIITTARIFPYYDTTAGPGGTTAQFSTVSAASSSGAETIFLKEGTVTETAAVNISANNTTIIGENRESSIWALAGNLLTLSGQNILIENLTITSTRDNAGGFALLLSSVNCTFINCRIKWAHSGNPTNAMNFITDNSVAVTGIKFIDCIFENAGNFANEDYFVAMLASSSEIFIDGALFVSGGSSSVLMSLACTECTFSNFDCDFDPAALAIVSSGARSIFTNMNNVSFSISGGATQISNGTIIANSTFNASPVTLNNLSCIAALTVTLPIIANNCTFNNAGSATVVFGATSDNSLFSNCFFTDAFTDDAAANHKLFHNCRFTTANTLLADHNQFANCYWELGLTIDAGAILNIITGNIILGAVSVSGDNNLFSACRIGADAGGGANTITFNAGGDNNIAADCFVDAAIVDNGTGNVTNYTVY